MATPSKTQQKPRRMARNPRRKPDIVPEGLSVNIAGEPKGALRGVKRTAASRGRRVARAAGKAMKQRVGQLGEALAHEGRRRGGEAMESVDHAVISLDELVRRKPVKAVGAALLAGLLLGLMSKGR